MPMPYKRESDSRHAWSRFGKSQTFEAGAFPPLLPRSGGKGRSLHGLSAGLGSAQIHPKSKHKGYASDTYLDANLALLLIASSVAMRPLPQTKPNVVAIVPRPKLGFRVRSAASFAISATSLAAVSLFAMAPPAAAAVKVATRAASKIPWILSNEPLTAIAAVILTTFTTVFSALSWVLSIKFKSSDDKIDSKIESVHLSIKSLDDKIDSKIKSLDDKIDSKIEGVQVTIKSVHVSIKSLDDKIDSKIEGVQVTIKSVHVSIKSLEDFVKAQAQETKDSLRLAAQATMNPSRAHLIYADQRSTDEIISDPANAPLASKSSPPDTTT
jgi:hypothetical protein